MTTSRVRRTRGRPRGRRRPTEWFHMLIDNTISTGGQEVTAITANVLDDEKKGMTIARWFIDLTAAMTVASAGGLLTLALSQVQDDAAAASAYPEADINTEQPGWLWRVRKLVSSSVVNDRSQIVTFQQDLRAVRRFIAQDYDFVLQAEYTGVDSVNLDGSVRFLAMKA